MNRASRYVVPNTPIALPSTSPSITPIATGLPSAAVSPDQPPMVTPAAKKANTGTATPADSGRSRCSKCSASPGPASGPPAAWLRSTGTANPSSTPATVACTPEACTSPQVTTARGMSSHQDRMRRCTAQVNRPSGTSAPSRGSTCSSLV